MGWEPSYLVSKLYNLINDEGENKRQERKKKKRDNKVACLFYFSPKWINSVLYIWVDIY